MAPRAELRGRILAAARSHPIGPRAEGTRKGARYLTLGLLLAVAVSVGIGRPSVRGRPMAYVVALAVAWMLIGVAATWAGVARGRSMLGRPAGWRLAVALLTPAALFVASTALGFSWPQTLHDHAGVEAHLICIGATMAFALGPLLAFFAIRRASDPVSPQLSGAAIGAAAGAWGALGIELHCRFTSTSHVLLGHVLPVMLVTAAGLAAGSRVMAIRLKNG